MNSLMTFKYFLMLRCYQEKKLFVYLFYEYFILMHTVKMYLEERGSLSMFDNLLYINLFKTKRKTKQSLHLSEMKKIIYQSSWEIFLFKIRMSLPHCYWLNYNKTSISEVQKLHSFSGHLSKITSIFFFTLWSKWDVNILWWFTFMKC